MLSLEIIGILGALFVFLVYGLVKATLARRQAGERRGTEQAKSAAAENGHWPPT